MSNLYPGYINNTNEVIQAINEKRRRLTDEYFEIMTQLESMTANTASETESKLVPSEYLQQMIKLTDEQKKQGKTSPIFDNAGDAIKWLNS